MSNKVDYQPSARDSVSGRFSYFKHGETGNLCASSLVCTSNRTLLRSHDYTALVNWTRNLRPNVINQARFQFSPHCTLSFYPELTAKNEREMLAVRVDVPARIERLQIYLTRDPQPSKKLFELDLTGPTAVAPVPLIKVNV